MSRNTKAVNKKSKKSVKKIITEMDIIDGINKGDLTGLVNENNLDVVIELYKKIAHYIDASKISRAITNDICAEKFYNFVKNYKEDDAQLIMNLFNNFIFIKNNIGDTTIADNIYSLFIINKFLIVNSLNDLIMIFINNYISKNDILNFLKKNFYDQLYNLANNADYEKEFVENTSNYICGSNGPINFAFNVRYETAVILRMFNANPK